MPHPAPIGAQLRSAIQAEQARVAAAPFGAALAAGELPLTAYVGLVCAVQTVARAVEHALAQSTDAVVAAVWASGRSQLPALAAALARVSDREVGETPVAALEAELAAQRIRRRAHSDPLSLLGYLYVLHGPLLDQLLPSDQLARAFGVVAAPQTGSWALVVAALDAAVTTDDAQARICAAAREAADGLARIVKAVHPVDPLAERELARTLNPDAGAHAIPTDGREVQAALRAGEHTLRQFPYYTLRYGTRGEQFTRSDSAWLVTLTEHPLAVVEQQILWLGRLLAARGMPRWLLEQHLLTLHAELVTAVPEKRAAYAALRAVAASLQALRTGALSAAAFDALDAAFAAEVGAQWSDRLPHTGALLAAAVADERAGIRQAVPSLVSWMSDAERFPAIWIAAVERTLQAARAQSRDT